MMALPDKRFTFDAPRARTTLAHLIEDPRTATDPRDRNYVHLQEWATRVECLTPGSDAWRAWVDAQYANGYAVHNHVWVAKDVLDLIAHVGGWSVVAFRNTSMFTNVFVLVLRKDHEARAVRLAMLRSWIAEPMQVAKSALKRTLRRSTESPPRVTPKA